MRQSGFSMNVAEFELISKGVEPRDILSDDIGRSPLSDDTAEESDAEDDLLDIDDDLD